MVKRPQISHGPQAPRLTTTTDGTRRRRRAASRWLLGALAFGSGLWLGCDVGAFQCSDHDACRDDDRLGICQATGYCSFPDEDCKSGQRYGELVGDMLAETCVEPSPPGGESELGDESGGDDGGTDDGRGQDPEDDDGGGGEDTGSQDPTVGGTIGPDCWRDDFDDTFLDPRWCPVSPSGTYLTEVGGSLQVFLEDDGWGPGHRDVRLASCMDIPFAQSRLTVRVDEVLLGSPETESYVEFQNDDYGVGILYVDGNVWAYQWNGNDYVNLASLPYDAQDHAYWRLRSEHQGMVAELSPDGANWTTLHTYDVDVGDGSGTVKLGVWAEHAPNGGDRAAQYGWLETCTPPS